jgi:hypothetical protein
MKRAKSKKRRNFSANSERKRLRRTKISAPHRRRKPGRPPVDWAKVDWSKPNSEIAAQHGYSLSSVYTARKRLGKGRNPNPRRLRWDSVDWSRPLKEIAAELGCQYQLARRIRAERGFSKGKHFRHNTGQFMDWVAGKRSALARMSVAEIHAQLPFAATVLAVRKWCRVFKVKFRAGRPPRLTKERLRARIRRWPAPRGMSDLGDCWILGNGPATAYPRLAGRRAVKTVWDLFHTPLRPGVRVVSKCGNRHCVNPRHLKTERLRVAPGSKFGGTELTPGQIAQIKRRWQNGGASNTLAAIADEFGLTTGTVWRIVSQ